MALSFTERKKISPEDFTEELYQRAAKKLFEDLEKEVINPAGIISLFTQEEEQREAAALFNTKLLELSSKAEKERALHDILMAVKRGSLEALRERSGTDVSAFGRMIVSKKELEELSKTHISLD